LSESGKMGCRAKIMQTRALGETNMYGGLQAAAELLLADSQNSVLRRIFLFSDGLVNVGIEDSTEFVQSVSKWADAGITTCTFGIGMDFDAQLMRDIARAGRGRYFFIEGPLDIPKQVSLALHDVLNIFASEAVLELVSGENTCLRRVYGTGDDGSTELGPPTGVVNIGDLCRGKECRVLLELDVSPPACTKNNSKITALRWHLKLQRDVTVQLEGFLQLEVTKDQANLDREDETVRIAALVQDAAIWDTEAVKNIDQGNFAAARQCKQQQIFLLRQALLEDRTKMNVMTQRALQHSLEHAEHLAVQMERDEQHELIRRCCVQESLVASWVTSDSEISEGRVPDCSTPRPPCFPPPLSSACAVVPRSKRCFFKRLCPCGFNVNRQDTLLQCPHSPTSQPRQA